MSKEKSVFDDFEPIDDISLQQILNNLLDGKNNLDLKSHIIKPKDLASLKVFSELLGQLKWKKSNSILESFIKTYLRYMISYERKSRTEIIKAISSLFEQNQESTLSKLSKNMAT